jgi:hypothetical protein
MAATAAVADEDRRSNTLHGIFNETASCLQDLAIGLKIQDGCTFLPAKGLINQTCGYAPDSPDQRH